MDGVLCLFVPNAFSPNRDGHNDRLEIIHCGIQNFELHVYNRWGQRVFSTNDPAKSWDGKSRGIPQPLGVYAYYLNGLVNGQRVQRKGNVTLMR
jgi:gliding motility-associated-like protein